MSFCVIDTLVILCIVTDVQLKLRDDSKRKTLGEQAMLLRTARDRMVALRRTTAAMQVLLARTIVMKALSLLSVR